MTLHKNAGIFDSAGLALTCKGICLLRLYVVDRRSSSADICGGSSPARHISRQPEELPGTRYGLDLVCCGRPLKPAEEIRDIHHRVTELTARCKVQPAVLRSPDHSGCWHPWFAPGIPPRQHRQLGAAGGRHPGRVLLIRNQCHRSRLRWRLYRAGLSGNRTAKSAPVCADRLACWQPIRIRRLLHGGVVKPGMVG